MSLLANVERYYSGKIVQYGPTAKGVDWNSSASQTLRFKQLLKIVDRETHFTLNDYGCGYGALLSHMSGKWTNFEYRGFDISSKMIANAKKLHANRRQSKFFTGASLLAPADYTVASGIFNVKLGHPEQKWKEYMRRLLHKIDGLSVKGFAFNCLTQYSDREFMRPDLYYADPCFYFDYCKRNFSRAVTLLHDYPLFEFTILVRKERGADGRT